VTQGDVIAVSLCSFDDGETYASQTGYLSNIFRNNLRVNYEYIVTGNDKLDKNKERMGDMALLGDPFVANLPRPLSNEELIQALRVDIAGELEAIIGYEAHIMATTDERVKKVLTHIANEERRHVGQLQQLLFVLNPGEQQYFDQGLQAIQQQQSQNFQMPMQ